MGAAIETCRRELSGTTTDYMHGQSECSEQTSSDVPVLEEFMPIKRSSSSEDNDEQHSHKNTTSNREKNSDKKKSDWLRSVQLWNQSPDPLPKEVLKKKKNLKLALCLFGSSESEKERILSFNLIIFLFFFSCRMCLEKQQW